MYGLIDSGASDSLIPYDLMSYLGIDEATCAQENCETAGGMITQFIHTPGLDVEIQQMGTTVPIKAAFSKGLPARLVLLGRKDFFAQFKVEVDERAQSFTLHPYS